MNVFRLCQIKQLYYSPSPEYPKALKPGDEWRGEPGVAGAKPGRALAEFCAIPRLLSRGALHYYCLYNAGAPPAKLII